MSHLLITRRQTSSLALKCAVGAVVATPLAAICQASYFLLNYRINHANGPRPECPSRGALLVQSRKDLSFEVKIPKEVKVDVSSQRPIRLLVIGDSLAMGIGASSPLPVLPVSIAQSLSKHLGGRIVDWTCHGKPGLSTAQLVKEIEVFRQEETAKTKDLQEATYANEMVFVNGKHSSGDFNNRTWKQWRAHVYEKRNPNVLADYDAVVVIIGMGDLKAAALPFLHVNEENHGEQPSRGFKHDLVRISDLFTMRNGENSNTGDENPLVVFPALPARTVTIFQYPPLSWFVIPLTEMLDADKRFVASTSSGNVLFVEEPSSEAIVEFEEDRGSLKEMLDNYDLTFAIGDTKSRLDKNIKQLTKDKLPNAVERCNQFDNKPPVQKRLFKVRPRPASTFVAPDKIHPNNIGYDFWGRHIACCVAYWQAVKLLAFLF